MASNQTIGNKCEFLKCIRAGDAKLAVMHIQMIHTWPMDYMSPAETSVIDKRTCLLPAQGSQWEGGLWVGLPVNLAFLSEQMVLLMFCDPS